MKIYLVRHGETGGNVAHRHQAEHTPLTPAGKEQAVKVAEAIKEYEPTHLVTSSLVRAIETSVVIGEVCNLTPETNTVFVELERPKTLYGHFHKSPRSLIFYMRWYVGLTNTTEGESYPALRKRILHAKEVLATYPADARVVVVTHSVFMSLFLAHACRDKMLNPVQAVLAFVTILRTRNTQVIPVTYNPDREQRTCAWMPHV